MNGSGRMTVDLVVPVYNEAAVLVESIKRTAHYVRDFKEDVHIIIADNASTDATEQLGQQLAAQLPGVSYLRLNRKGRGHALRVAWDHSLADVVAYMDVDLSTPLAYLPQLFSRLRQGVDVVTGSRLLPTSHVAGRRASREVLSRGYNLLLRTTMGFQLHDAQCGFKAMHTGVYRALADEIQDSEWFFDTELLLLAQYRGYVLAELAVHWTDDPGSSVHVGHTVAQDLRGMWRMWRVHRPDSLLRRLTTFGVIGVLSTLGYGLLYLLLTQSLSAEWSNLIALVTMTVANTGLNRAFTFRRYGATDRLRHYMAGFAAFGLSWAFTAGSIWVLLHLYTNLTQLQETVWVTSFSLAATLLKYAVFARVFQPGQIIKSPIALELKS